MPLGVPMDNPWSNPLSNPWSNPWSVPPEIIQQVVREYEAKPVSLFDKYIIADHMNQIFNAMRKNDFCNVQENLNKLAYDLGMLLPLEKTKIENYKKNLESYIYTIIDIDTSAEKADINIYIKEIISFIDKILVGFAAVYEVRFQ